MHAEQFTGFALFVSIAHRPPSIVHHPRSISPFHPSNLPSVNLQPTTLVPQTTNQEHTPITSKYTRKQAFLAHQNGQNIFVPRKRIF
jgi:hypothetical protein